MMDPLVFYSSIPCPTNRIVSVSLSIPQLHSFPHMSTSSLTNVQILPNFQDSFYSVFSQSHLWSSHHEKLSFSTSILSLFSVMAPIRIEVIYAFP